MLKLIKYEYRRNLASIVVALAAILLVQGFFLFSVVSKRTELVIGSSMFLIFTAGISVFGMMLFSVALYSRELNAKTSYLTFMTPNSVTKILGAKLLAALVLGLAFAGMFTLIGIWDYALLSKTFPEIELGREIMEQLFFHMGSTELSVVITTIAAIAVEFLISFFTTVVVAYLAITLAATVLQNKKLKGLVSFVIFVAIMAGLEWGKSKLSTPNTSARLLDAMLRAWPQYAANLCVMVGAFALSARLLDRKVSL
ncbi:MAG: hypothetical protein ACOYI5_05240 [Christensenellales bacterium]|jgi:ABC-2 type transport system permease protein